MAFLLSNIGKNPTIKASGIKYGDPSTFGPSADEISKSVNEYGDTNRKDFEYGKKRELADLLKSKFGAMKTDKEVIASEAFNKKNTELDVKRDADKSMLTSKKMDLDNANQALFDSYQKYGAVSKEEYDAQVKRVGDLKAQYQSAIAKGEPQTTLDAIKLELDDQVATLDHYTEKRAPMLAIEDAVTKAQSEYDLSSKLAGENTAKYDEELSPLKTATEQASAQSPYPMFGAVADYNPEKAFTEYNDIQQRYANQLTPEQKKRLGELAGDMENKVSELNKLSMNTSHTPEETELMNTLQAQISDDQSEWVAIKGTPYNPQVDNIWAGQYRAQRDQAEAKKAQTEAAGAQDKTYSDVRNILAKAFQEYKTTNADDIKAASIVQGYIDAFSQLKKLDPERIAKTPALLSALVKSANKLVEPTAGVMSDDVNMMVTNPGTSKFANELLAGATAVVGAVKTLMDRSGSAPTSFDSFVDKLSQKLKEGTVSSETVKGIIEAGNIFVGTATNRQKALNLSMDYLGKSLLMSTGKQVEQRLNLLGTTPDKFFESDAGKAMLKEVIGSNVPSRMAPGELKNIIEGVGQYSAAVDSKTTDDKPTMDITQLDANIAKAGEFLTEANKSTDEPSKRQADRWSKYIELGNRAKEQKAKMDKSGDVDKSGYVFAKAEYERLLKAMSDLSNQGLEPEKPSTTAPKAKTDKSSTVKAKKKKTSGQILAEKLAKEKAAKKAKDTKSIDRTSKKGRQG
jgi:hypothetical protein